MVVQKSEDGVNDILAIDLHTDGTKASELKIPVNGKNCPLVEPASEKKPYVYMNGREIYKFAVRVVPESIFYMHFHLRVVLLMIWIILFLIRLICA